MGYNCVITVSGVWGIILLLLSVGWGYNCNYCQWGGVIIVITVSGVGL